MTSDSQAEQSFNTLIILCFTILTHWPMFYTFNSTVSRLMWIWIFSFELRERKLFIINKIVSTISITFLRNLFILALRNDIFYYYIRRKVILSLILYLLFLRILTRKKHTWMFGWLVHQIDSLNQFVKIK